MKMKIVRMKIGFWFIPTYYKVNSFNGDAWVKGIYFLCWNFTWNNKNK